jgi:hypothetical protein
VNFFKLRTVKTNKEPKKTVSQSFFYVDIVYLKYLFLDYSCWNVSIFLRINLIPDWKISHFVEQIMTILKQYYTLNKYLSMGQRLIKSQLTHQKIQIRLKSNYIWTRALQTNLFLIIIELTLVFGGLEIKIFQKNFTHSLLIIYKYIIRHRNENLKHTSFQKVKFLQTMALNLFLVILRKGPYDMQLEEIHWFHCKML